jgi:hypothetical protein
LTSETNPAAAAYEKPATKPAVFAEMILTFFTDISMEQLLKRRQGVHEPKSGRLHEGRPEDVNSRKSIETKMRLRGAFFRTYKNETINIFSSRPDADSLQFTLQT